MAWNPPPRITLAFSEHVEGNSGKHDLRLEYSTNTIDTADLNKANKQARDLARRHLKIIARDTEHRVPSKHYASHEDRSILIKALAIDTSMLKVDKARCSVFVKGEDDCRTLLNILRLPDRWIQKKDADGDMIEVQILTQIDYGIWVQTVGGLNGDHYEVFHSGLSYKILLYERVFDFFKTLFRKRKL